MKKAFISGGLGDGINQLAKLLYYCNKNKLQPNEVEITYCNDTYDNEITKQSIASNPNCIEGLPYKDYLGDIVQYHNFHYKTIIADQMAEAKSDKYDIVLGPNMSYDLKIWEERRRANIGCRPSELQIIPSKTIDWKYKKIENVDIAIHVRFADENPTKEKISFQDKVELLKVLKKINYEKNTIHLIGKTNHDLSMFSKIVTSHLDESFLKQYSVLLSSKLYNITFPGFSCNLSVSAGKKTYRKYWDEAERQLQMAPEYYQYFTEFNEFNDLFKIIGE